MPFTASQLGEVPAHDDVAQGRAYDVELPYRRLGRCRMSGPVAVALGTQLDEVAAALSMYEERNGRAAPASTSRRRTARRPRPRRACVPPG